MRTRPYQKLIVWKESHNLCLGIYKVTKKFPSAELYGLTKQMRSSSSSVPTNIAEGNGRRTKKDKKRFLVIAEGSLEELHYQCVLAKDLGYITSKVFEAFDDQIQRVGYLIYKISTSLS